MAKTKRKPTPKKRCNTCNKEKSLRKFYKVDSPLFPDGRINTCSDCVRETVDVNDLEQVILFLRQIDKPFIERIWEEVLNSKKYPLGAYIAQINSLNQYKGKTFNNSDGVYGTYKDMQDEITVQKDGEIETETGEIIKYTDDLVTKWGTRYSKLDLLKLEKFYQDMMMSYEVTTANHKQMLMQLAKLSLEMDRLLAQQDYANYAKVSSTYETLLKSAGFRPIDKRGSDEQRGIRSFSQVFEEVEKRGFIKPPPPKFDEDIIDAMIMSIANYYHRLVGKELLSKVPEEMKKDYEDKL